MVQDRPIFGILVDEKDPAADAALLAALDDAELPTCQAIVETLIARKTKEALKGLVAKFHLLDEPLRRMITEEMDSLFSVLRECSQSRDEQERLNVLELIRRGCVYQGVGTGQGVKRGGFPEITPGLPRSRVYRKGKSHGTCNRKA